MLTSAALPTEFEFESEWSSPVVFHAAHVPQGWIVAAVQHGVRAVLSLLDPELEHVRSRVVSSGKNCTWGSARPLALPDGRCLLSVAAVSPASFELDLSTLELAAPPAWCACGGEDNIVMQLAPFGDRIILGIGDARRERRLMSMPADARKAPAAFFEDFEQQLTAAGSLFVGENSAFERMVALGDSLLLVHRYFLKMKAVGHALLAVSSSAQLAHYRDMTAKPERARFSADLQWFSDPRRELALLYGGRVLEAVDAKLASHGRVDGHALFKALIPIAADGAGGLLWRGARKKRLVATRAAELDPRELASSIAELAGQYASSATSKRVAKPARATKPARGKASPIARPALDLAKLDDKYYRESRDKMLAWANGTLEVEPGRVFGSVSSSAVHVAAFASAIEPEHPVIAVSTRLAAQAATGEISAKLPGGGGNQAPPRSAGAAPQDEVSFALGAYTITRPVRGDGPNAYEWSEAWMRATIARDRACLDILEDRPDAKVLRAGEDYRTPLRSALIAVRRHPDKATLAIERARELARPQHVRYEDRHEIAALRAPLFPMLRALAARNEQGFERALLDALALHRKFYSTPSRRLSQHGIIAWAPLALCRIARDLELRFEAETEYLPRVLL